MIESSSKDGAMPNYSGSPRIYWLCQMVGWGLYVLVCFASLMQITPKDESVSHYVGTNALVFAITAVFGISLTHQWRAHIRRKGWIAHSDGLPLRRIAVGVILLALLQLCLVYATFQIVRPQSYSDAVEWLRKSLLGTTLGWIAIYLIWTILYVAVVSRRHTRRMEIEKLQLELLVKDAELRALQAQVNPHFFFNSLNSIRALIYQDAAGAAEVIDRLANIMRYTLQSGQVDTVTVAQEMQAVRNYLAVEKIRFEERLQIREAIDSGLDQMAIPPMALQTLVENAVKYGVELRAEPSELHIRTQRDGNRMQLSVSNQGQLRATAGSTKIGVQNTGKRLALIFGPDSGIDLTEADGWVTAKINLPCTAMVTP